LPAYIFSNWLFLPIYAWLPDYFWGYLFSLIRWLLMILLIIILIYFDWAMPVWLLRFWGIVFIYLFI
jgi:hypothetical protein